MATSSAKKKLDESYEVYSNKLLGSSSTSVGGGGLDCAQNQASSFPGARYMVTTINAQYKPGMVDGLNNAARFRSPTAVCEVPASALRSDVMAAVLVADTGNNALRMVELIGNSQPGAPAGIWRVSVFGAAAEWMRPRGVCATHDGFAVCDAGHHRVRHVTFDGAAIVLLAGRGARPRARAAGERNPGERSGLP